MSYHTATWNSDTITIATEDTDRARSIAAEVFNVDQEAPMVEQWDGAPEMSVSDREHERRNGWY